MFAGDKLGQNETYKSSNCVILSWSSFPLSAMLSTRVTITLMALPLWCSAQSPLHALRSLDCSTRTLFQAARRRGIVHEGVMWLSHNEITSSYAVASHLQGEMIPSCPYSQVPWHLWQSKSALFFPLFFYISFPSAVSGKFLLFLQTAPEEGEEVQVHKRKHLMTFCSPLDISAAAMKWWRTLMALGLACQFFQFFVYVSDSPNCLKMTPHRLKNKKKKNHLCCADTPMPFLWFVFPFLYNPHLLSTCSKVGFAALTD